MKILCTLLFLWALLMSSSAVNLKSATTLSSMASSQLKTFLEAFKPATGFGQEFLSTLMIKVQSGDRVENVISFIEDLKSNLQTDQDSDDSVSQTKNQFWNESIATLEAEIQTLNEEIAALQLEVATLQIELQQVQKEIQVLNEQIVLLQQKQANLEAARTADIAAFNQRIAKQNTMIAALNTIITNLTEIVNGQSFIQKSQVLDELRKIPQGNALSSFLTISTGFTPATVNAIIQKLKEIRESLQASIEEDEAFELVAQENYLSLINEFETTRNNVQESLVTLNEKIVEIQNQIDEDNQKIADNQQQVEVDQQQVDDYKAQQAEFNALYQKRYQARFADLQTIQQALDIINQNSDSVKALITQKDSDSVTL